MVQLLHNHDRPTREDAIVADVPTRIVVMLAKLARQMGTLGTVSESDARESLRLPFGRPRPQRASKRGQNARICGR